MQATRQHQQPASITTAEEWAPRAMKLVDLLAGISLFVHIALMFAATLALPVAIAASWGPPTEGEALWLLGLFTLSIGLPFFALSANGPLLQAWFARTFDVSVFLLVDRHPSSRETASRSGWTILSSRGAPEVAKRIASSE
jgi:hypothetical protein